MKHKKLNHSIQAVSLAAVLAMTAGGFLPMTASAYTYSGEEEDAAIMLSEEEIAQLTESGEWYPENTMNPEQTVEISEQILDATTVSASQASSFAGSNKEAQNQEGASAKTVKSYLAKSTDGYMRFQYVGEGKPYVVEYYDKAFQLVSQVTIDSELPIWGGFYMGKDGFFVVTGQANPEQDNTKEVVRVTKYNPEWGKVGSVSLKGANTITPFSDGSCRMAASAGYLVVRTSHTMYKGSDAKSQQANLTFAVDMNKLTITDSFSGIMNKNYGYVAHSLNQFVLVDKGHIVALDQGDSFPRSAVLTYYKTNVNDGVFSDIKEDSLCKSIDVFPFKGNAGVWATGASIGGFEMSSTSYITAGNSVKQDEYWSDYETRNIWVASTDKYTNETKVTWITDYAEGSESASTPQLVALDDDTFILLWSRGGNVYYQRLNSDGSATGYLKSVKGNLSDCKPIVSGNRLIWYVWDQKDVKFYNLKIDFGSTLGMTSSGDPVQDFVERMYVVALERPSEAGGLKDWTTALKRHDINGSGIASGFIGSAEFKSLSLTDDDYVDTLYATFFNRPADEAGRSAWLKSLASGKSRMYVLSGFVNSQEFDDLCAKYGIVRGYMFEDGTAANPGIYQFVERMYTKALARDGERTGIDYWATNLISKKYTAESVAKQFFQSDEFKARKLSNEDYVETLYQTFLNRASDKTGKTNWVNALKSGKQTRDQVLEGFAKSNEFNDLLKGYGLK